LIEVMIAILFITIGFFGYVALHSRILHSGQRLEEREVIRSGTDFLEAIEVGRITLGYSTSVNTESYSERSGMDGLYVISTSVEGKDTSWKMNFPEEYHAGLDETLETAPTMMAKPHQYSWGER
jgi:Tfp pilus assembly protein PilV